jgi:hypothetical protein
MVNNLAPAQYRALCLSLAFLLFYMLGIGFGAQLIGLGSDWFSAHGQGSKDALRYACIAMVVFYFWAAFYFLAASRGLRRGYLLAAQWEGSPDAGLASGRSVATQ